MGSVERPTRYIRAACIAAIRNPLQWIVLKNIPRTDKARVRLLYQQGPKLLEDRSIKGRFDAYERDGAVWVRFIYPWQEDEHGHRPWWARPNAPRPRAEGRVRRPREAEPLNHDEQELASTVTVVGDDTAAVNP